MLKVIVFTVFIVVTLFIVFVVFVVLVLFVVFSVGTFSYRIDRPKVLYRAPVGENGCKSTNSGNAKTLCAIKMKAFLYRGGQGMNETCDRGSSRM